MGMVKERKSGIIYKRILITVSADASFEINVPDRKKNHIDHHGKGIDYQSQCKCDAISFRIYRSKVFSI